MPGEDLPGVVDGITFLREISLGRQRNGGQRLAKVAVIGGGNTAVDAARSALRLGAEKVTVIYRRSRAEMPVSPWELADAEAEGVKIEYLAAPARIIGGTGVRALECIRMELGEPDETGRRRPMPILGSEFTILVDTVITAIGQLPETSAIGGVELTPWGTIAADAETGETSQPGVFAGGDAVGGAPATVIDAVAAGNRAAESISRYLNGMDLREGRVFGVQPERIAKKEVSEEMAFCLRSEMPAAAAG